MSIKYAEIENLLKLSDQYDEEGRTEESAALFAVANRLIQSAEKEKKEEEGGRQMSGKAKAKFRAVKKACEALCSADLDYRGPYKKECRKVETLCEDILEALTECSFD